MSVKLEVFTWMLMSNKLPVILDLFCGAGGCAKGYYDAGFEVVGVDISPQPRYPYTFIQYDALKFLQDYDLSLFDSIHASPPCQFYTQLNFKGKEQHPDLVNRIRFLLLQTGLPYIIENVVGAPMKKPIMLCGTMFDLGVIRHRLFESNVQLEVPIHKSHHKQNDFNLDFSRVYGSDFQSKKARIDMGIDWMVKSELSQAIPPVFTEYLGKQLMKLIQQRDNVDRISQVLLSNIM
jgi:DNA (cytosine-5)-methyltransferase 1